MNPHIRYDRVAIATSAAASMIQACAAAAPLEACGFLLGRTEPSGLVLVEAVLSLPNVSPTPRHRFAFEPQAWVEAFCKHGDRLVGLFHSHPDGPDTPSEEDRRLEWACTAYLVVAWPDKEAPSIRSFLPGGDWREQKVLMSCND